MNTISWKSPSNIALVKYWGKKHEQIPINPSISFTLSNAYTITTVEWEINNAIKGARVSLLFDNYKNDAFEKRVNLFVNAVLKYYPKLNGINLKINSSNSFPHSSGIASSASSMSALALCLTSIEMQLSNDHFHINNFNQKASFIARLGSGSAARSVYGGVNLWGTIKEYTASSNDFSIDITNDCHPDFLTYNDAILLVSDGVKKVSSTAGHSLMNEHPYAKVKVQESFNNTSKLLEILKKGDLNDFTKIVEAEALALHAMMMTSNPNFLLMEPNTLAIINKIYEFRNSTDIQACFTLDAGANVHLLYPDKDRIAVLDFINSELTKFCKNEKWIDDKVGKGPIKLSQSD